MNYVFLWMNYVLNQPDLVQILCLELCFIYVLLCFILCFIMFYYGWTSEHDWFTPPSTRLDRTFGLSTGVNQNLVQIKTEVNQGIGSREPIPGSNRFFIAICASGPPRSCQTRWTNLSHLNQLNQFEPRRNYHLRQIWATTEPYLSHNWAIFEPNLSRIWAIIEPESSQNRARAWKMIGQNDRAKNLHYHFALSFFRPGVAQSQIWTRFEPDLNQNWAIIEP